MGGGGAAAGTAFSGFKDNNRFDAGDRAGSAHEFAGVGQVFHIEQNGFDRAVIAQIVDHFAEIDIEHGADADKMAESGVFLDRPVEDGGADGPALGDDRQIAFGRHAGGKAGIQLFAGPDDAQAVWADDPQS